MRPHKLVSIIVPCRNEVDHLDRFLNSLFKQDLPPGVEVEVLVADGRSDDGTRELLERWKARKPRIHTIDNLRKIVSTGLNAAILRSRGEIVIRMDVHTVYARNYVAECLHALDVSRADNVGGPWVPRGGGYVSKAIALAFASRFVSGGGKAHDPNYEGYLDTVYLGCWRREAFSTHGLFDEDLVRSQDNELNLRIQRNGGKIWQTPRIRSWYTPRSSVRQLFRQYAQYGYWKVRVIRKHRIPASVRQVVPGCFLGSLLLLGLAAPFSVVAFQCLLAIAALYSTVSAAFTVGSCRRNGQRRYLPLIPVVFAAYHFGFGYGFLRGAWDFLVLQRSASHKFAALTRAPSPASR